MIIRSLQKVHHGWMWKCHERLMPWDLCHEVRFRILIMHQSVPSANIPPAPGQKSTFPREYFKISGQPFLLIGVEILEFCRNQTSKRTERLPNYSLVIPSSFSLSTILYHSKVPSALKLIL